MQLQFADLILLTCGLGLLLVGMRGVLSRRQLAMSMGPRTSPARPLLTSFRRSRSESVKTRADDQDKGGMLEEASDADPSVRQLASEISSLREIVQGLAKELKTIRESLDRPRASRN
jgi:hypothetical protein